MALSADSADTTRLEFSVSNSKASICAFVGRGRALWKVTQPSRWVAWVTAELKIHQGHVLFFFASKDVFLDSVMYPHRIPLTIPIDPYC